jgi:hypothetical protein
MRRTTADWRTREEPCRVLQAQPSQQQQRQALAARSAPYGYTVSLCAIHHSVLPGLEPELPYDIEKDFDPISFGR